MQASYSGSNRSVKYLFENATEVSVEQILTSGTPVATITVDGSDVDLYAPAGGGSDVVANPVGTPTDDLDTIEIDGVIYDIPGSGGGSGGSGQDYECDLIFDTPATTSSWADPIEICTEAKAKEYDALYITANSDDTYGEYVEGNFILVADLSDTTYRYFGKINPNSDAITGSALHYSNSKLYAYSTTGKYLKVYKVYGLKFKSSIDIFSPQIYSEEERVVGTWTDGRPLYQKTAFINAPTGNYNAEFNHNISGLTNAEIKHFDYDIQFLDTSTGKNAYYDGNYKFEIARVSTTKIYFIANGWNTSTDIIIQLTLQYTKTTDTAGSSHWLSGGVMAINYTEDEQIIGQYLGKTLYQKTFLTNWTSNGEYHIDVTSLSIDNFIYAEGFANRYDVMEFSEEVNVNFVNNVNSYRFLVWYNRESEYLRCLLNTPENRSSRQSITIRYTKTTDTAGNPMANILATQKELEEIAYHYREHCYTTLSDYYSAEERVVGRWTDGKPLYQKTYSLGSGVYITNSGINISSYLDNLSIYEQIIDAVGYGINSNDARVDSLYLNTTGMAYCAEGMTTNSITVQYTKTTDIAGTGPTPGNLIYLPALYSEEEREVGVWTNGKPLYQKTFHFVESTEQTNKNYDISSIGADYVKLVNSEFKYGNTGGSEWYTQPYWYDGSNNSEVSANVTTIFAFSRNWKFTELYATIQYTKTTDQPGSGKYLPDGQLAHHYSTSEKIVGTWIDGSTVYERTWDFSANPIQLRYDAWIDSTIPSSEGIANIIDCKCLSPGYLKITGIEAMVGAGNHPVGLNYCCNTTARAVGYLTLQYTKSS